MKYITILLFLSNLLCLIENTTAKSNLPDGNRKLGNVSDSKSRSTFCDSLSIVKIETDSLNQDLLNITIHFDAPSNVWLNYPYVDCVLDHNSDTVAKGQMGFFAQMGGTSQIYQTTVLSPPLVSLTDLIIIFKYDINESCIFGGPLVAAESICDFLSIINMEDDSLQAELFDITVLFDGPDSLFLNYPYVDYILDRNNDTLAKGQMNLFGHVGGTSATYQVTVFSPPLDPHSDILIVFRFNGTDSCVFGELPANGISESTGLDQTFRLFPNPAKGIVNIGLESQELEQLVIIRSLSGKKVFEQKTFGTTTLDLRSIEMGIYLVEVWNSRGFQRQKLVVY